MTWRLDPPAGVRKHPATSSNPHLGALHLDPVFVDPGPLVDSPHHPPAGLLRPFKFGPVYGRHHRDELVTLGGRVPPDAGRDFLDQVDELLVTAIRGGDVPPDP